MRVKTSSNDNSRIHKYMADENAKYPKSKPEWKTSIIRRGLNDSWVQIIDPQTNLITYDSRRKNEGDN